MAELECDNTGNTEVQGESTDIPMPLRELKSSIFIETLKSIDGIFRPTSLLSSHAKLICHT